MKNWEYFYMQAMDLYDRGILRKDQIEKYADQKYDEYLKNTKNYK